MHRRVRRFLLIAFISLCLPGGALHAATWIDVAELTHAGGAAHDFFGQSVAIDGDVAVVGDPKGFYNGVERAGVAHVFVRSSGKWSEAAELLPSDSVAGDHFGSIAIHGDTIAVGSPTINVGGHDGIVYVFVRPAGGWSGTLNETARLDASGSGERVMLGGAVAFAGNSIVTSSNIILNTLFVFNEPSTGWSGTLAPNAFPYCILNGPGNLISLAASGNVIVAGAPSETVNGVPLSGRACVWTKPAGGWSGFIGNVAELVPSDPVAETEFGDAVGIDGNTVVVTRRFPDVIADTPYLNKGYIFEKPLFGWAGSLTEEAQLVASDGQSGDAFGLAASISGNTVVIGAVDGDFSGGEPFGSAYVFDRPSSGWAGTVSETAELTGPQGGSDPADEFGFAVAISASTIVVGSPFEDWNGNQAQGVAHVFELRNLFITRTRFLIEGPIRVAPGVPVEFPVQVQASPLAPSAPIGVAVVADDAGHACRTVLDGNGAGNCSLTFTSAGIFRVRAHYLGNAEFSESTSPPRPVRVGGPRTAGP